MADLLSLLPRAKSTSLFRNNKKKLSNPSDLQLVVNNDNNNPIFSNASYISSQVARQGRRNSEIVHSSFQSLVPRSVSKKDLLRPSKEEEEATANRTKAALDKLLGGKIGSYKKKKEAQQQPGNGVYVKYQGNSQNASKAKQRVIRMVEEQIDPLEPAKFKHKKEHI